MGVADWLETARSLLSREQWAIVLVLAGAVLMLVPPDRAGLYLIGWLAAVVAAAFVAVLFGSRLWPLIQP